MHWYAFIQIKPIDFDSIKCLPQKKNWKLSRKCIWMESWYWFLVKLNWNDEHWMQSIAWILQCFYFLRFSNRKWNGELYMGKAHWIGIEALQSVHGIAVFNNTDHSTFEFGWRRFINSLDITIYLPWTEWVHRNANEQQSSCKSRLERKLRLKIDNWCWKQSNYVKLCKCVVHGSNPASTVWFMCRAETNFVTKFVWNVTSNDSFT